MLWCVSLLDDDWGLSALPAVIKFKFKSNLESDLELASDSALTILNCGLSFLPVFNTSRNDLAEA